MNSKNLILLCAAALAITPAAAKEHLKSLNKAGISNEISAGEDFYRHVNQKWMDDNPLTPEHSRYGQFNTLDDSSKNRVRRIVANLASTNPAPGTVAYKIASLYQSGMDSVKRNQLGAQPIQAILREIESTPNNKMEDLLIKMHKSYSAPFFAAGHQEDLNNSSVYAMFVSGAPLNLGDRDYYLGKDADNKKIRNAYQELIKKEMQLAGYSKGDAARIAKNVLKIETLLADSTWSREESRNLNAMNNVRDLAFLKKEYPNIPWDRFFVETMGFETPDKFIITTMNTVKQGDKLLGTLTPREKKDYYAWQVVDGAAPYLSDDFIDANFEFNKIMSGVEQQQPRWKVVQKSTESKLGEAIGQLYVEQYFPESSKKYMEGLVENLRTALGKHIINLPWMSDETKLQAIKKLNAITVKIGYPDQWKDYSTMEIDPNLSYYENIFNANNWLYADYNSKWGKPVDRTEWAMTPQTVNAYYNPLNNEIVFPAAILQAPFFDEASSDAENYGGIGVVIGHELTHGFDDQGCNFDAVGNMVNWWTPEDAEAFASLTKGLADQFDQVEVLPGLMANGSYTLGENIADQGGLRVAMTAFLDSQKKKGVDITSEEALIDGIDPLQVFYMNYANLWAQNVRDAEKRKLTIGDVHSLGENRVNVSLKNIAPFFKAFNIKEGDKMYRPEE
ncbi:MAG: M13 family metallopeptidase, partial [Muribaculaceae bacterium]|nr:M13 family metallopeptidase [Muribaculaceae bacterium]